jgi:hypothetical protein
MLLGRCSCQLRKSCAGVNVVYLREELVLMLEHCVASKSFAELCKAFINA